MRSVSISSSSSTVESFTRISWFVAAISIAPAAAEHGRLSDIKYGVGKVLAYILFLDLFLCVTAAREQSGTHLTCPMSLSPSAPIGDWSTLMPLAIECDEVATDGFDDGGAPNTDLAADDWDYSGRQFDDGATPPPGSMLPLSFTDRLPLND